GREGSGHFLRPDRNQRLRLFRGGCDPSRTGLCITLNGDGRVVAVWQPPAGPNGHGVTLGTGRDVTEGGNRAGGRVGRSRRAPGTGRVNQNTDRTEGRRSGVWALPGVATGLPSENASGCVRELQWQALSALCPLTADLLSCKRAAVLR